MRAGAFDVVVVGAGSSGCVVAARIAANPACSVLLLEAGPDLRAQPPELMHDAWRMYREHSWGFESEPDPGGAVEPLHRGRLVGGTGWVTRFALRGSPADFAEWVQLGNSGWGFDDVLPWFTRIEDDLDFPDRPWHGTGGPIPVTRYPGVEPTDYHAAASAALAAQGFDLVDDHNRPGTVGFGRMPRNARDGARVTTADAYLPSGGTPSNLHIRSSAPVAELVLEGTDVTGVRLVDGAVVDAGRVVLCAGTYGSPALLMRSGIGPADHLRSVDVDVRVALAGVGANLADHPGTDLDPGYRRRSSGSPTIHSLASFHSAGADGSGPPDLALWVADPEGEPAATTIDVLLMKPESRGTVRLRSADPADPPRIELPGLRAEHDVRRLCEGFARAVDVARSAELQRVCGNRPAPWPDSPDDVLSTVRAGLYSVPHVVGTCAMGPSPDDGAVVDSSGQVHGVGRLSVIDASIIPVPPSGFPHLITIMLAERLASSVPAPATLRLPPETR